MANVRYLQRSFGGGEVTPEFFGRIDDVKYQTGLATCRNFITKPHGPAENRAGFGFVREVRDSSKRTRLLPFTFSTTQTMVIEMGAGYFRFHTQGGTVLAGSVPYEVWNGYAEWDLFDIHYVQSADVLTLVHPNYPPHELRRLGATNWEFKPINFAPLSPPGAPVVVNAGGDERQQKYTYTYVITAVAADGVTESMASGQSSVGGNLYETGQVNTISWNGHSGASRYNVYKLQGGIFGYIGQTSGLSIIDDDIDPDLSKTPPMHDNVFLWGGIQSVPVVAGGSGYGSASAGGVITAVSVVAPGGGYNTPVLTVSDPTGSGAVFAVTTSLGGMISGVTVVNGGSGYSNPTFHLSDTAEGGNPAGSGAAFSATISPVIIRTPVLSLSDPSGNAAVLAPVFDNGVLVAVNVINPGYWYSNPSIWFSDPAGGSGAVFGTPTLSPGGNYPGAVSYFEQRRCFAGTYNQPQNIWMTRSGTETDMSYSLPLASDDRISFRVAAREANTIRHIVPLTELLLLTSSAEWRVTSLNSDAITPTTISVRPQSYVGASNVQPVIINNSLIYGAARGGHVREMGYNWQSGGFVTGDLSLRAPHLFDGLDIVDMGYAKAPTPLIWFVSSNGRLLGLTYVPDQQVGAWHWHDTDGTFESIAVVAEGHEDVLYAVVRRTIKGVQRRYVERMRTRQFVQPADAFFVDCGSTYSGSPTTTISGLGHLEGKEVAILADGAVHPKRIVTGGQISLDIAASKVQVGLPIFADLKTLPVAIGLQDGSFAQGRAKNVNKAWLRVHRSSGIFIGPNAERLTEVKQRIAEAYGQPPALKSEEIEIVVRPDWGDSGQVFIRQYDPLPLTVVNLTLEVALGG